MTWLQNIASRALTKTTYAKPQKEPLVPAPAYDTLERAWCKDRSCREDHTGEAHIENWYQKIDPLKLPDGN